MVNFQKLINDIRSRNRRYTLNWIADECGVGLSTISMIKDVEGREPRYHLGVRLVELEKRTRSRSGSPDGWTKK